MEVFNEMDTTVLGISVDSPWANAAFAEKYDLNFELLSDLDRSATKDYDFLLRELGGMKDIPALIVELLLLILKGL